MLHTKADAEGVAVIYDGDEYFIIPNFTDDGHVAVMCRNTRNEWDFYGDSPYESIAEACNALFYGTVLVTRTECGHILFDKFGRISGIIPLDYYGN